jgi:hypothetical protein
MLDTRHGLQQVATDGGADVLDQGLVIEGRFSGETRSAAYFLHKIDQLLGVDI